MNVFPEHLLPAIAIQKLTRQLNEARAEIERLNAEIDRLRGARR